MTFHQQFMWKLLHCQLRQGWSSLHSFHNFLTESTEVDYVKALSAFSHRVSELGGVRHSLGLSELQQQALFSNNQSTNVEKFRCIGFRIGIYLTTKSGMGGETEARVGGGSEAKRGGRRRKRERGRED